MYLYNMTIITDQEIHGLIRQQIEEKLISSIPEQPGCQLLELLDSPHEGVTYCVQIQKQEREELVDFQHQYSIPFQHEVTQQYPGMVLFFESSMKYLVI